MDENDLPNELQCSICNGEFDIQLEGGIAGYIGVVALQLCPMCHTGLDLLYSELHGCYDDEEDDEDDE